MTKDAIRAEIRGKRKLLTDSVCRQAGRAVAAALFDEQKNHRMIPLRINTVCVYLSYGHELPTRYIIRKLFERELRVAVPVWDPVFRHYTLSAFLPGMPLVAGPLGVKEPLERIPVQSFDIDLQIVPGLAFDYLGGRLGHGGGHYDRILAQSNRNVVKVGVCHDFQLFKDPLPQEDHDSSMDWIITEKRIVHCSKAREDSK